MNKKPRLPTLFNIDATVPNWLSGFIFYWLPSLTLAAITWKASALPDFRVPIAGLTLLVASALLFLQIRRCSDENRRWPNRIRWLGLLLILGTAYHIGDLHRPLVLFRADLQDAWLPRANLRGAVLFDATLKNAHLYSADLTAADLAMADLSEANLSEAHLSGANLTKADLPEANLYRANLSGADLIDADLSGANLSEANLSGAHLSWANLREADLSLASLREAVLLWSDLSGADLTKADLSEANLSGANLSGANLFDAGLSRADVRGADVRGANLRGAFPIEAHLTGAIFWDPSLKGDELETAKTEACAQLTAARGWQTAYRDPVMACGAPIPKPPPEEKQE